MTRNEPVRIQLDAGEATEFCIRRLASLEARFILLCERAQKAGIDCADLRPAGMEIREIGADGAQRLMD